MFHAGADGGGGGIAAARPIDNRENPRDTNDHPEHIPPGRLLPCGGGRRRVQAAPPRAAAGSPFVKYVRFGLQADAPNFCAPPSPEVIRSLRISWQRAHGG